MIHLKSLWKIKKATVTWLTSALLLCFDSYALEVGFCFPSRIKGRRAIEIVYQYLTPGERFLRTSPSGCIEVDLKSHRRHQLLKKLLRRDPGLRNSYLLRGGDGQFSSGPAFDSRTCRFSLLKKENIKTKSSNIEISKQGALKAGTSNAKIDSTITLVAQNGMPSSFRVYDTQIWYRCQITRDNNYAITLSLSERLTAVSTAILLGRGQTVEIGSNITQAVDGGKNIDLSKKAEFKNKMKTRQLSISLQRR